MPPMRPISPRLHYDASTGWVVDTDVLLPRSAMARLLAWAVPKQQDRVLAMPPGDRREQATAAVAILVAARDTKIYAAIKQNLINRATRTGRGELTIVRAEPR